MLSSPARLMLVLAIGVLPGVAFGQPKAPNLSKEQRQSLLAAVTAAKAAQPLPDEAWQFHLLRASDGSHYIAFSAEARPDLTETDRLALYVRLEPRTADPAAGGATTRSAVEEWLLGQRSDPLPMRASRVVQVPTGEMPVGGNAGALSRDGSGQNSAVLALMERQRQKEREERAAREKARRDTLEGRGPSTADLLPFEDFDMAAHVVVPPGRRALIRRAITSGPGEYDIVVGWAVLDARNRPTRTGGLRHALSLPPAQSEALALGSVILADEIRARTEIYPADQQTAHPYTIGGTEIEPAGDRVFSNDERLAVVFQVFNAVPNAVGKPDVGVSFRLFRKTEKGEEPSAALAPLDYTEGTLPVDFNLNLGHPLLAAFAAPLRTLPRGDYRLSIAATDRLGRSSATAETTFRIVATGSALLRSAPAYSAPFGRARLLEPPTFDRALDAMAPSLMTPALRRLEALARQRRFVDLLPHQATSPDERGAALVLQAIAAYALGDTARAVSVQLRRAMDAGGPSTAAQYWLGASLAFEGRDDDAIAAWVQAGQAGWPRALLAPLVAEAHVRQGRLDQAGTVAREATAAGVADPTLPHMAAAADIAGGRFDRAVESLSVALKVTPDDADAQWLMVHALFASLVAGEGPGAGAEGRARLLDAATRYIDGGGRHQVLAREWRDFATSSAGPAAP